MSPPKHTFRKESFVYHFILQKYLNVSSFSESTDSSIKAKPTDFCSYLVHGDMVYRYLSQ